MESEKEDDLAGILEREGMVRAREKEPQGQKQVANNEPGLFRGH